MLAKSVTNPDGTLTFWWEGRNSNSKSPTSAYWWSLNGTNFRESLADELRARTGIATTYGAAGDETVGDGPAGVEPGAVAAQAAARGIANTAAIDRMVLSSSFRGMQFNERSIFAIER
jgi:hypothetical protein